ncbi:uncharacterized protein [Apostichopus japonicus]|uniref:uncharacterized protein n=1 Tax=Stichopus japonicus TaxID=307972 RepID=UPI003AB10ECE
MSMAEREILDYKKDIADKTGQDVKEIERSCKPRRLKLKKPRRRVRMERRSEHRKLQPRLTIHGDQLGMVETTTVSIVNGEKEGSDDRAPSPTPEGSQSVESSPSKDLSLSRTKKKKTFRTPSFLSKKQKNKKAQS